MSRCGRTAHLDALCWGELSAPEAVELRAHAATCAVCRHELRWAETEKSLFSQRAVREEVRELWQKTQAQPAGSRRVAPWVAAAMAAVALLSVFARGQLPRPASSGPELNPELLMTIDEARLMTPASPDDFVSAELEASLGACLMMTPGQGGSLCPPAAPASFDRGN